MVPRAADSPRTDTSRSSSQLTFHEPWQPWPALVPSLLHGWSSKAVRLLIIIEYCIWMARSYCQRILDKPRFFLFNIFVRYLCVNPQPWKQVGFTVIRASTASLLYDLHPTQVDLAPHKNRFIVASKSLINNERCFIDFKRKRVVQEIAQEHEERKTQYDGISAGLESNRAQLEHTVSALSKEVAEYDGRYYLHQSLAKVCVCSC